MRRKPTFPGMGEQSRLPADGSPERDVITWKFCFWLRLIRPQPVSRQTWKVFVPMLQHLILAGRMSVWTLLCVCCLSNWALAQNQQRPEPAGNARPQPLQAAQVGPSPEMVKILQTWEQQSAKVKRSKGEFSRIEYDAIFLTAKCSNGKYWFESPDKGRMDFSPNSAVVTDPPTTVKKGEVEYTCQADQARTWICNGKEILDVDTVKKEYNRVEIPAQFQGQNISDGPLPFLFGMKAKKLQKRYLLELGSLHDPKKIIHIVAYPKMAAEQREYRVAEVLLNPETYLPHAVQLMDPTGNKQTVYVFSKHEKVTFPWLPTAPWNVPMLGYTELTNQQAGSPPERDAKGQGTQGIFLR